MSNRLNTTPNDLRAFWMPFTANRQFKQNPRMLVGARDMHFTASDGRKILDGTAGLWCVNAGHCRPKITEAIAQQAGELDYAPAFQMGHPKAFELANRLVDIAPDGMDHVLFTNSGSESVETALKVALAYHRVKGNGSRTRLIGRERGYHGVNFGGISVGGIVTNRKMFGTLLTGVDHMPHTHLPAQNAFTKGQPELTDVVLPSPGLMPPEELLYLVASVGCAMANSVEVLIAGRFFQALGGCVGMVAARAMVRDLFEVKENAKVFSSLMLVVAVSPILPEHPQAGVHQNVPGHWHRSSGKSQHWPGPINSPGQAA